MQRAIANQQMLDRPIIILGAARSGTTLLGDILSQHPAIAYWVEPRYIWRYRNPTANTDRRAVDEATPEVKRYIRSKFASFVASCPGSRFMEKTPSNCFRVPFIHAVFPGARFVHLIRDGRDVVFSARRKWTSPPKKAALWRRLSTLEIPLRDLPFYLTDFLRDVIGRQLYPDKGYLWGPHVEGLRAIKAQHGVLQACAVQWRESIRAAREGLTVVPGHQQHCVQFEQLVADPGTVLQELLSFAELSPCPSVQLYARDIIEPDAAHRWSHQHSSREVQEVLPMMREELQAMGYAG
jgi:hypothetical protein